MLSLYCQVERPWRLQQMKYSAYWCIVHNSEYDHHNLFLAHSIFLLFISLPQPPSPPFTQGLHPSLWLIQPPHPVLYFFSPSTSLSLNPFSSPSPPAASLCSLALDNLPLVCPSLFNTLHLPSLLVPGQRRPTKPFQQLYKCMMS